MKTILVANYEWIIYSNFRTVNLEEKKASRMQISKWVLNKIIIPLQVIHGL